MFLTWPEGSELLCWPAPEDDQLEAEKTLGAQVVSPINA